VRPIRPLLILLFFTVVVLAIGWLLWPALQPDPIGEPTPTTSPTLEPALPAILTFTGHEEVCMDHVPCAQFEWATRDATSVSMESGSVEDGVFQPGGWDTRANLPPNGSHGFMMKIGNDAARLCIQNGDNSDETVCAVCVPANPDTCVTSADASLSLTTTAKPHIVIFITFNKF
jgi:hypothetical protein